MAKKQRLFLNGTFALGIFATLPATEVGRLGVVVGFSVLLWSLEGVFLSRRLRFGLAAGLPLAVWLGFSPSLSHCIAVGGIGAWALCLWGIFGNSRRWVWWFLGFALSIGLARTWQEILGFGMAPWHQLLGLGAVAAAGIYLMRERQQPQIDRLVWQTRHFAHEMGTPLHVIQFCADQWKEGDADLQHAKRLMDSATRSGNLIRKHRENVKGWLARQPVEFFQVWNWVTDELPGAERFQIEPRLGDQLWEPEWVDEAGRSLRDQVSKIAKRFNNSKIVVKTGPKPPNLQFFPVEEIANSEIKKEGGACKRQPCVAQWRVQ